MEPFSGSLGDLVGKISRAFDGYVDSFREGGELPYLLELKRRHSYRVREEALAIARSCGLGGEDLLLAFSVGLLHDVGRFPQYKLYRTFNDSASADHGELGAAVLRNELGGLKDLVGSRIWELTLSSVELHNKRVLPQGLSEEEGFWARLVRDADRLDVYRVIVGHLERGTIRTIIPRLEDTKSPPSDEIVEELLTRHSADYSMVKSLGDLLLVQISWAYDMSFHWSAGQVIRRGIVNRIGRFIPQSIGAVRVIKDVLNWLGKVLSVGPSTPSWSPTVNPSGCEIS
ncbi:putative HD superfamily hydrolase involved in NAD metabolism [Thermanaerovibrio velox DSM 12556]|uniref:Putative HD superfamily hydrolase involved in NAD metabolism n=1 Tax=Thermanaerovibrio velox DSM 12556 TaxID=926567 RepID=H0UNP3_9BACT|nr:HD domain-containing protein [Thermanaerovibrio velox]EHM10458.1 putative HD superfamily hydrolase involved in NAD metabolism [Thermanaerovibrio velox DSM 12556]